MRMFGAIMIVSLPLADLAFGSGIRRWPWALEKSYSPRLTLATPLE